MRFLLILTTCWGLVRMIQVSPTYFINKHYITSNQKCQETFFSYLWKIVLDLKSKFIYNTHNEEKALDNKRKRNFA